jgi:hypothetical protein
MLVLGLVFALIALVSDTAWCLAAGAARTWFGRGVSTAVRLTRDRLA